MHSVHCFSQIDTDILPAQVQSGGSFDLDYEVTGPEEKIILSGEKERQGDFVFTAQRAGDYKFCFNNDMSTYTEKVVDFEIAVRTSWFKNWQRQAQLTEAIAG